MRISDWSSDVCSADLTARSGPPVTCRNYFTSRQYSFFSSQARNVKNARNRITQTPRLWRLSAAGSPAYSRKAVMSRTVWSNCTLSCVPGRSEEHTSELQSLMRSSYAVFCLKKQQHHTTEVPVRTT